MRKHILLLLNIVFAFTALKAGGVYSFEQNAVPASFAVKTGSLKMQSVKAKLGDKSLQWNWTAGDTLTAVLPDIKNASVARNGGITVWIYNERPINAPLNMWFLEYPNSTTRKCNLRVNLNFKGWRRVTARFRQDMKHPGYTLRSMKWSAPNTGSGTIYIDYLEFVNEVSWERMSDWQYQVNNPSAGLNDFLGIHSAIPATTPAVSVSDSQRDGIKTIDKRLKDWHLGSDGYGDKLEVKSRINAFNNYVTNAKKRMSDLQLTALSDGTVQGKGLYPIDFHGKTIEGEKVKTFREINERYLFQLTYDAVKNNNTASQKMVRMIFDWYYDQGWAAGSALGTLRFEMLRSSGFYHSAYVFSPFFTDEQTDRIIAAQKWFTLYGKIHQSHDQKGENTDEIRTLLLPKLFTILSLKNETEKVVALQKYVEYADNALSVAGGYLDCIKPDYSGYHHRGVYYNAYFPDALYAGALVYYVLSDTPFALNRTTFENLKHALLTFQFVSSGYHVQGGATGRFPAQTKVLDKLLPTFAYLALSSPEPDAELTAAFKALWKPDEEPVKSFIGRVTSDITFKNTIGEVEKMVELAEKSSSILPVVPIGTKVLPYAGMFMSRHANWTISMKGYSKYIWDFEASSTENLYGRYLSYGHIHFSKLNTDITSFQPADAEWDWSHMPGTTAKYLDKKSLSATSDKQRNFSDDPFLGGIAFDTTTAVFANSLHDNTFDKRFSAKKSVFQFEDLYYAMGSGIKSPDTTREVHTTLFQNKKRTAADNILLNGSSVTCGQDNLRHPVIVDNYGTAYILKDGNASVKFGGSMITAYINHGAAVTNGSYGYLMIPEAKQSRITNLVEHFDTYFDIVQDENVHSIYYKPTKTFAAAIFNATSAIDRYNIQKVNVPMVLVAKELNDTLLVAFSDPDMHRPSAANIGALTPAAIIAESQPSTVKIELKGRYEKLTASVEQINSRIEGERTVVEFNQAKDGRAYFVTLKKKNQAHTIDTLKTLFSFEKTAKNRYSIKPLSSESYSFKLVDVTGKVIFEKRDLSDEYAISLDTFPSGVFILHAICGNKIHTLKIIRQ